MPPTDSGDASSQHASHLRRAPLTVLAGTVAVFSTYLGLCMGALLVYSVFFPPLTGVQLQREIEALLSDRKHNRTYLPVSLDRISSDVPRAVIAGEDTRFFDHPGLDWKAIQEVLEERQHLSQSRGASTITQQLVKNLFMTTHRSYLRKGLEVPLAFGAEAVLSKRRILELYVNVIEWGPATYGAEAAARYHYGISAAQVSRSQAAALAACIPNPRNRTPQNVGYYQQIILHRMKVLEDLSLYEPLSAHSSRSSQASSVPVSASGPSAVGARATTSESHPT